MSKVTVITKNVLTRDWNDLEPKLITFLATGVTASGLILLGNYLGLNITSSEAALGVTLISAIAGYFKKSSQTLPPAPVKSVTAVVAPTPVAKPPVAPTVVLPPVSPVTSTPTPDTVTVLPPVPPVTS